MTIELKPEQERVIRQQLASGNFKTVDEVLTTALASLTRNRRFDPASRREAVRRMMEFSERRRGELGEPVTREFLHKEHRL